tara:strand:+ start:4569 stop:5033 length:465 start_codon:yes stop_codon:yes gene_type:complete
MNVLEDFKIKLVGLYNNQRQAFNHPQQWANIFVEFVENSDGDIDSKSWYVYEGSDKPYKRSLFRLESDSNKIIANLHQGINLTKVGKLVFEFIDGYWIGEDKRFELPNKNIHLETIIKFDGVNYLSRDAGYRSDTNTFLWGKREHEGMFHFVKQ